MKTKVKEIHRSSRLLAARLVAVCGLMAALVAAAASSVHPAVRSGADIVQISNSEVDSTAESLNEKALSEIDRSIEFGGKTESLKAAVKLRELGIRKLTSGERETWLKLARDVAIRNADLKWLQALRSEPDSFALDNTYSILLAYSKLAKADAAGANSILNGMPDANGLNVREQRRIYALRARIAEMTGDTVQERTNIEKLVDHLPSWPTPKCQSCHSTVTENAKITGLQIKDLWFGQRFVELMRKQGDAEAVRAASEAQLRAMPGDDRARIRLAFAFDALDRPSEADRLFRELAWADLPGRHLPRPHMIVPFP